MNKENIMKIDRPINTEKLIDLNGGIIIPMKFKLHQKVYHPRITSDGKLIDIREYYIVRINIVMDRRGTFVDYHASPCRDKVRGHLFHDGKLLFKSHNEAMAYAKGLYVLK